MAETIVQPDTQSVTLPEDLNFTREALIPPSEPQRVAPDSTTQPDPAATVALQESQRTPVGGFWTVNQTLNQTFKKVRQLSPRGMITLLILLAVVLSGSGLLYYAYAAANRPAQHRGVATRQVPTQTGVAQQTSTITPVGSATSTAHQSVVDVATPTPVPQIVPTPTTKAASTPTPTPEAAATPTPGATSVSTPTPTPKPTCPPQIQSGSKGTWVTTLQQDMNKRGMTDSAGKALVVDGNFGAATQYAVKRWQAKEKIVVDGIVGPQTWHSLGRC